MLSLPAKRFIPLLLFVFLVFLVGCDTEKTTQPNTPFSTAPSDLHAEIDITDHVQSHSADVIVQLTVKGDPSTTIRLNSQESLSCDNVSLKWVDDKQYYDANVSDQPEGGKYTFNYTNYGNPATITIRAPSVPTFTSPTKDVESVQRSTNLRVSYQAPGAWQVEIYGTDDTGNKSSDSKGKNTGSTIIDASSLIQEAGTLRLAADYILKPESADFTSAQANYHMNVGMSVVWA